MCDIQAQPSIFKNWFVLLTCEMSFNQISETCTADNLLETYLLVFVVANA